ncbi:translation initiation factor IF-2-like [Biomphalaria glabrata]|uniref:Translation initiation factor IF-2-like n=1 Tax=Biomphalaria glabrata TaxID=6526 RepID=A0A9W2YDZ5_BIOGL|nr:translation initiation factor IF-2-like [Biomphalaria glabrata]XP_055860899.1 translation initiation factor IF-2-like [Biomphalaria glabrata]
MERFVKEKLRTEKTLEKTLDYISQKERNVIAKHDRRSRDLGLELTNIKKTTLDLDYFEALTPRPSGPRRGSLPQIESEVTKSPLSRRRLSIAAIPVTPKSTIKPPLASSEKIKPSNSSEAPSLAENGRGIKTLDTQKTVPSQTNNRIVTNATKEAPYTNSEFNSQAVLPKIEKQSLPEAANRQRGAQSSATIVFKHEDADIKNRETGSTSTDDEEEEKKLRLIRARARRSSEPNISKHFVMAWQNGLGEAVARSYEDGDKAKQMNHHLEIVTEQDETETEVETRKEDPAQLKTTKNLAGVSNATQGPDYPRQRRKSEGDILKAAPQLIRLKGMAKYGQMYPKKTANDEVWDSVRKCRYIRGYDPPEMTQPADVNQFVFGKGK